MKLKRSVVLILLITIASTVFGVNENVIVWENIYKQAPNDEQRLAVMLRIMQYKDRDFAPVINEALGALAARRLDIGTPTEVFAKVQLAKLIIQELGNLKYLESSELIFEVYKETNDPFLKGEAALALGKIRAVSFSERLAQDLSSINLKPDPAIARNQEILALGLVQALSTMRVEIGFEPVFNAANAWYSTTSRVKETARDALLTMVDDPSDSLRTIVEKNPDMEIKLKAVELAELTRASAERKALVASMGLKIGVERVVTDLQSRTQAMNLRAKSMDLLAKTGDKTPANATQLITLVGMDLNTDLTLDETLRAYRTLGINGSAPAISFLVDRLGHYNRRQGSNANSPRDKTIIIEIINALKVSKNVAARPILDQTVLGGHDNNIRRAAEAALREIQ